VEGCSITRRPGKQQRALGGSNHQCGQALRVGRPNVATPHGGLELVLPAHERRLTCASEHLGLVRRLQRRRRDGTTLRPATRFQQVGCSGSPNHDHVSWMHIVKCLRELGSDALALTRQRLCSELLLAPRKVVRLRAPRRLALSDDLPPSRCGVALLAKQSTGRFNHAVATVALAGHTQEGSMTVVLEQERSGMDCSACGFVYEAIAPRAVSNAVKAEVGTVPALLASSPTPEVRREAATWSPLEYACHLRDVLLVQRERVLLTRRAECPSFEPMGREERVDHDGYANQLVDDVARQIVDAALLFGNVLDRLGPEDWHRLAIYNYPAPQERSLAWIASHTLHETVHHVGDIRRQVA
jgi:hypothetical protein